MGFRQNLTRHWQHGGVTKVEKHDREQENAEISLL